MKDLIETIRLIIREEIGRNYKTEINPDLFPWAGEGYYVSINPKKEGGYQVSIQLENEKSIIKDFSGEGEAIVWVKNIMTPFISGNKSGTDKLTSISKNLSRIK
ncbi:MAG: hypothetical protein ACW98X_21975 [Promethearchaeota archaeon]|jgi:hypothetical protein